MKKCWLLLLVLSLIFTGCSAAVPTAKKELFAMDTVMNLTVFGEDDSILTAAEAEIRRLEALLSVNGTNGDIYRLNSHAGEWVTVSEETAELLERCKEYSAKTNGLFDVTVYPAVQAWGFMDESQTVPDEATLQRILPLIDHETIEIQGNRVRLHTGMGIDLGGIAKGYAADQLAQLYKTKGASGVLSLGGNVLTVGEKPDGSLFTVGVQDPADSTATLCTLQVAGDTAVVTSGDYQRYFEQDGKKYHHILDPRTAAPADSELTSVTVLTASATLADAYSTALYVMGLSDGLRFVTQTPDLEAVLVTKEKQVYYTSGAALQNTSKSYVFKKVGE